MGILSRWLNEAIDLHVDQWRPCPECGGRKEHHRPLRDPTGRVPVRKVVVRVQCGECKGKGKVLLYEQWRERGKETVKIYRE